MKKEQSLYCEGDYRAEKEKSDWPKYIALFLTVLSMAVCMVVWATAAHGEIKDWTAEQQYVTKQELKEVMKERYAPLTEVIKIQTCLEGHMDQHIQLKEAIDRLQGQLDRIERSHKR